MARNLVPLVLFIAGVSACGIIEPDYRDYTQGTPTTAPPVVETPECTAAGAEFAAQMATPVKTCLSCHTATSISGKALKNGDDAVNRAQLKAYATAAPDKLFNKISLSGTTHQGGNHSATMPKANIDAWLAKETLCI